ncbi:unnamed protein product [Nippostrongylus brasiliensis]|uniref:C-type lectin domain-containing protein n=1 Tax=Nippostrongylus brasiliensis TaxID=27835 RepID=A0A0N4XKT1_NIPBR|nr:unnamed protein product [Nippostrongylus brasiliensis]
MLEEIHPQKSRDLLYNEYSKKTILGIRTVDPYSGYSYNYIELPSHRCEREQRNSEARFDRFLTHLQLKHDKDIRALTKRMELLTSRVFKRGEYEYISILTRKSWYDAEEDCIAWGGHLVSVVDKEENDFVRGSFSVTSV